MIVAVLFLWICLHNDIYKCISYLLDYLQYGIRLLCNIYYQALLGLFALRLQLQCNIRKCISLISYLHYAYDYNAIFVNALV